MRTILLLGDIGSIHLFNLIKNVLVKENASITAVSSVRQIKDVQEDYLSFYYTNNITLIEGASLSEIGVFKYLLHYQRVFESLGTYDLCLIQFVSHFLAPIVFLHKNKFLHIRVSFWGSDVYRVNFLKSLVIRPLLHTADRISFITESMRDTFVKKCKGGLVINKSYILDFGNLFFNKIEENKNNVLLAKSRFGVNPNKIIITVGYSGRQEMQQRQLCEELLRLPEDLLSIVFIVVPAVGITEEEKRVIENLLSKIPHRIYDYFMDAEETALLRSITDVFLYGQTTDALSSAMLEHLFAGSILIKGVWLKYDVLEKKGVFYLDFDSMRNVPSALQTVLYDIESYKSKASFNQSIIASFCSWNFWYSRWHDFIN